MKTGRTILELAQELLDQQKSKRDFNAQTKSLNILPSGEDQGLVFIDKDEAQEDVLGVIFDVLENAEEVCVGKIQIENS
jgi:hypothetical protein